MPRRSRRIKRNKQSGNKFGDLPRKCVVDVLMNFDIYKVASNHRVVCREFRDAGSRSYQRKSKNIALFLELDIQYHVQGYGEFFVGCLIGRGKGNKNKQAEWYTKSAELGNALAMNKLGTCYAEGTGGLAASRTKAIELFTTSAKAGCAAARSNLAELILSKERADGFATFDGLQLMLQSAQQGFDNAQYQIGLLSGGLHVVWTFDVVGLAELVPVDHEVSFTSQFFGKIQFFQFPTF
jgi:hypothetical protein